MKIFDIFSKLKEKDLPVAKIEEIVIANLVHGINDSEFDVKLDDPADLSENDRMCRDELFSENKKVVYINATGHVSDRPFEGINIVVNPDGNVSKMVK